MADPKHSGIYAIRHIATGKIYVGSALSIRGRWANHRSELRSGKHRNRYLLAAWKKYGEEAFVFEIIEEVSDPTDLIAREQFWIDAKGAFGKSGYNVTPKAGSCLGVKHSEESRERMRIAGLNQTPEHREKNRIAQLGRTHTPEAREKIAASKRGKKREPFSAEARANIAASVRGRKHSAETRAKMSAAGMGKNSRPCKPEARVKISEANRGKKRTDETKARMSAATLNRSPELIARTSERLRQVGRNRSPEHQANLTASIRRSKAARRAARLADQPETAPCLCGCGKMARRIDRKGRLQPGYMVGHHRTKSRCPDEATLRRLYLEEMRSGSEIARMYGVNDNVPRQWMLRHEIPLRNTTEVWAVRRGARHRVPTRTHQALLPFRDTP